MRITKLLHLSTAHVDEATGKGLDAEGYDLPVAAKEYGWLVTVYRYNPDDAGFALPASLQACLELAERNGCSHILFDCDEEPIADLPVYDW